MMKKNMMYGGKRTDKYPEPGVCDKVREGVRYRKFNDLVFYNGPPTTAGQE